MAGITGSNAGSHKYYIAGANTYQVVTGKGVLRSIVVNTPVINTTIKLIDNTSGSTVNIGTITNPGTYYGPYTVDYNIKFTAGLRIVTSGADDITVVYD